jgi:hypothetical protein
MSDYSEHLISEAGGDGDILDHIQARADAATEGPWDMAVSSDRKWALVLANSGTEDECRVARAVDDDDANFIALARTDVPALLAMVRDQRAVIDRVNGLVRYLGRLAPGDKHYAGLIRAALTATEATA